jgi:hypothetical protein
MAGTAAPYATVSLLAVIVRATAWMVTVPGV